MKWLSVAGAVIGMACAGQAWSEKPIRVEVTTDPYQRTTTIVTDRFKVPKAAGFLEAAWATSMLRDTINREGAHDMELYVDLEDESLRGYFEAFDSDGNKLVFNRLSQDAEAGASNLEFDEQFSVDVSRDYLEKHRATGLNIKFDSAGRAKDLIVQLPAAYIEAFLAKVDQIQHPSVP